jgi:nucleoside-diphosphate-sugar epimerase
LATRVLVTGHTGYIGPHAVELLVQQGHFVKGVDIDLYEGCDFSPMQSAHVSERRDILHLTPADFEGVGAVIHLAGLSNDPLGELDPALTWRINHEGTMHVAECAKKAGVGRFLFSSSCSIYGKSGDKVIAEDDDLYPVTTYGETKIACERDLAGLADDSFSPVYLRNATAYGPSPRLRLDLVLNNLVAWAHTTGEIRIMSDGTPWRPLVHCRDIAGAFVHLVTAPRQVIHNQAFNVGRTEENYQVRDLAEIVKQFMPDCVITYTGEGSYDARDYRVDFGKFARAFPDFEFASTVRDGAAELVAAYRRQSMTLELLEGPKFNRLRALQAGPLQNLTMTSQPSHQVPVS